MFNFRNIVINMFNEFMVQTIKIIFSIDLNFEVRNRVHRKLIISHQNHMKLFYIILYIEQRVSIVQFLL